MKTQILSSVTRLWCLLLLLSLLVLPSAAQLYRVTDLGTLAGGTYSMATAINSSGQVVGTGDVSSGNIHAVLWTQAGGIQDLGTLPGGDNSWAASINDLGHVTGGSWINDADNAAYLWTPREGMQSIVDVNDGLGGMSINDFDQVGGWSTVETPEAFVWTRRGGELNLNSILGGLGSGASGNNNRGEVVGYYQGDDGFLHAFLWSKKLGVEDLGLGQAYAINLFANVVGVNSAEHAFLWTKHSGMQDLGVLPGDESSSAAAVNIFGLVVGSSTSDKGSRAFLWSSWTGMIDLNTLIPATSGWTLSTASGINMFGQIVGYGIVNGQYHAFLLSLTEY